MAKYLTTSVNGKTLTVPTVHLNGTHPRDLSDALTNAGQAVRKAMEALGETAPNARDYYPQSPEAFSAAQTEHNARVLALKSVFVELVAINEAIVETAGDRI